MIKRNGKLFENERAVQYYDEITQQHNISISAPAHMVFKELDLFEGLMDIYKRNYHIIPIIKCKPYRI